MTATATALAPARPFIKWVGGKRSILPLLLERVPPSFSRYAEPFVGGGALFFALRAAGFGQPAQLADANERLVTTYEVVRDDVDALIEVLAFHADAHDAEHYRLARLELSSETDPVKKAALFIYLNKTCFNGVYRVNKADVFNMGLGTLDSGWVLDADNLRQASAALQGVVLAHGDFSALVPASGDFVYLDPPYDKTYTGYTTQGFDESFQRRVAELCRSIDQVGGLFLASNADTPLIRALYDGFVVEEVSAVRSVSCAGHQRGRVRELLISNTA
ncbi:MAG: DNA adenine methylase [Acidimicrobiales bacterium]